MKVSIICTSYNKEQWLSDAVESFLAQETPFPVEIILIDDASTDGSPEIIRAYQDQYPDRIQAYFNPENQGIAKTWILACQEARGQYIARCDGDDYWTDPLKLAKQVALLEATEDSLWSNTDFDMVDDHGRLLQQDVLANEHIPVMASYEDMLALKGMTMSSTWLVDRQLMLEVNQDLPVTATDDTFNLQLELFRRTRLTTLWESTTVYRMVAESDSRTRSREKLDRRLKGLYETQCDYLAKYPDSDLVQVIKRQAWHDAQQEQRIFDLCHQVADLSADLDRLRRLAEQEQEAARLAYQSLLQEHQRVIGSRRWTIPTKIINFLRRS